MNDVTILKRQGDILLERVQLSGDVSGWEVKDGVIARGETTGHAHRLVGGRLVNERGQMTVVAPSGASVAHEEHDTLELEPGIWLVHRQQEYVAPGETVRVYD